MRSSAALLMICVACDPPHAESRNSRDGGTFDVDWLGDGGPQSGLLDASGVTDSGMGADGSAADSAKRSDGGAVTCGTDFDCPSNSFCDFSVQHCPTPDGGWRAMDGGFLSSHAILNRARCQLRPCGGSCVGRVCSANDECEPSEFCNGTVGNSRCEPSGSCTAIVSCAPSCRRAREPHRYCDVCICPACP